MGLGPRSPDLVLHALPFLTLDLGMPCEVTLQESLLSVVRLAAVPASVRYILSARPQKILTL